MRLPVTKGAIVPQPPPAGRPEPNLTPVLAALALAACDSAEPQPTAAERADAYAAALAAVAEDPAAGAVACRAVPDPTLAADCLTAAAEALAGHHAASAAALCDDLPAGLPRDECHFQVAERSGDAARCAAAGAFADDCRLHRLSADLGRLLPAWAGPGDFETMLAEALPAYGLAVDDPRPWSAAYRWVLGRQRPLDRSSCLAVAELDRAEACRHTAIALFHDRLNHARDTATFPCDGGPLPAGLAFQPDAELQAALDERRARDLCP